MSGPYNGHILEFPQIRVDCFTPPPPPTKTPWLLPDPFDPCAPLRPAPPAQLYLLTHVHTDHLVGLSNDFTGHIICSADTKRLIPKLEAEVERGRLNDGLREVSRKKYDKLRPIIMDRGGKDERIVDRLEAVPYGVTKTYTLGYENDKPLQVQITLIEANHCPGSTMFLITSPTRAVLHTGDIRADSLFLQSLRRNPALGEFIVPLSRHRHSTGNHGCRTLDRMYLDTGAVLGTGDMPDREVVLRDLLDQMELYPSDTTFFLNVWCLGWEDVIKEVARHFDAPVVVDRYKGELFTSIKSDPFLSSCITLDPAKSRFHACERAARCVDCRKFGKGPGRIYNSDKLIVDVVMVEVKQASWDMEHRDFLDKLGKAALGEGPWPYQIQCPIARHSPLPELQSLVKLFRPKAITPNTIAKELKGIDYYTFPDLFRDCIPPEAYDLTVQERDQWFSREKQFGAAFLRSMGAMRSAGIDLSQSMHTKGSNDMFSLTGSEATMVSPPVGPVGRNRAAHRHDQLLRSSGLHEISVEDSKAILAALNDNGQTRSHLRPHIITTTAKQEPMSTQTAANMWSQAEDYDTDVERARDAKRRRTTSKANLASVDVVKVHPDPPSTMPQIEYHVKVEEDLKSEHDTKPFDRFSLPRKSFILDKEHLRALAMVTAEVDDL